MPLLSIQTSQSYSTETTQAFISKASKTVSEQLRKPESYVMICLQPAAPMLFAGTDAPTAYLELKSIGLPDSATTELSAALCSLVSDELSINPERIYIEFASAERHMWGWDGKTF